MSIDKTLVRHVARLACLELPKVQNKDGSWSEPEEHLINDQRLEKLSQELGKILNYVKELETLDLDGVEATSHGVPLPTKYRSDTVGPALGVKRALETAPASAQNSFRVPKVIE
jgi:aspartyl-tRNA(Asn)/glutamyl-tRNA(Gln) amidotransferase subunit C